MSDDLWQGYIDNNLIGSGHMHIACILSKADGSYWAYGGSYVPQPDEITHILKAIGDPDLAQSKGFHLAGSKCFTLRANPGLVYCKLGSGGACIAASATAIVVGIYGEGTNPANCNMTVEGIAKYLSDNGY